MIAAAVAVVVVAAASVVATARLSVTAIASARAQVAADAAALAGVQAGAPGATAAARHNGARLTSLLDLDGDVVVEVDLDGVTATARATR